MADMTDVKIRLNFWRSAYEKLTAAYTAVSYTHLTLPTILRV